MSENARDSILVLLKASSKPLTTAFMSMMLPDIPYDEVRSTLDTLCGSGAVSFDCRGFSAAKPNCYANGDSDSAKDGSGRSHYEQDVVLGISDDEELIGGSNKDYSAQLEDEYQRMLEQFAENPDQDDDPSQDADDLSQDVDDLTEEVDDPTEENSMDDMDPAPAEGGEEGPIFWWTKVEGLEDESQKMPEQLEEKPNQDVDEPNEDVDGPSQEVDYPNEENSMDDVDPDPDPVEEGEEGPIFWWTKVEEIVSDTRLLTAFTREYIDTVRDLVSQLSNVKSIAGLGEVSENIVRSTLASHAGFLPGDLTVPQLLSLCDISKSRLYVFDIFGRLCRVGGRAPDCVKLRSDDDADQSLQSMSIDNPCIPNAIRHAIKKMGIKTIVQAALLGDEQLMAFEGVGLSAVSEFRCFIKQVQLAQGAGHPHASEAAVEGARLAFDECKDCGYPVFYEAFMACVPSIVEKSQGTGLTPNEYRDAILDAVFEAFDSSDELVEVCVQILRCQIEERMHKAPTDGRSDSIRVPRGKVWESAAETVATANSLCRFNRRTRTIEVIQPRLMDWIEVADLDERTLGLVKFYLSGKTFVECGARYGMTGPYAQLLVRKALRSSPVVREDRYRHFFMTYDCTKADFLILTDESDATFRYLLQTNKKRGRYLRLEEAVTDELVPEDVRERLRESLDARDFHVGGSRHI